MGPEYCKRHTRILLNVTPFGVWCPLCVEEKDSAKNKVLKIYGYNDTIICGVGFGYEFAW